jgi:hypothetical protein
LQLPNSLYFFPGWLNAYLTVLIDCHKSAFGDMERLVDLSKHPRIMLHDKGHE